MMFNYDLAVNCRYCTLQGVAVASHFNCNCSLPAPEWLNCVGKNTTAYHHWLKENTVPQLKSSNPFPGLGNTDFACKFYCFSCISICSVLIHRWTRE